MSSKKRKAGRELRIAQRKRERDERQRHARRERLFVLETGGGTGHPMEVESVSQVQARAVSRKCPHCDERLIVDEHLVERSAAVSLRKILAHCRSCRVPRVLYFRICAGRPN